jgi:hypothetical protein
MALAGLAPRRASNSLMVMLRNNHFVRYEMELPIARLVIAATSLTAAVALISSGGGAG